ARLGLYLGETLLMDTVCRVTQGAGRHAQMMLMFGRPGGVRSAAYVVDALLVPGGRPHRVVGRTPTWVSHHQSSIPSAIRAPMTGISAVVSVTGVTSPVTANAGSSAPSSTLTSSLARASTAAG